MKQPDLTVPGHKVTGLTGSVDTINTGHPVTVFKGAQRLMKLSESIGWGPKLRLPDPRLNMITRTPSIASVEMVTVLIITCEIPVTKKDGVCTRINCLSDCADFCAAGRTRVSRQITRVNM